MHHRFPLRQSRFLFVRMPASPKEKQSGFAAMKSDDASPHSTSPHSKFDVYSPDAVISRYSDLSRVS